MLTTQSSPPVRPAVGHGRPLFGPGPVVIGHRGSGKGLSPHGAVENTVASLQEAVAAGAQWVEVDAQVTSDGVVVLRHDVAGDLPLMGGCTSVQARAAGWATLAEAHAALPATVGINVEAKVSVPGPWGQDPGIDVVVPWVRDWLGQRPWLLSSFDPSTVLAAVQAGVPAAWLTTADWSLFEHLGTAVRWGAAAVGVHAASALAPVSDSPAMGLLMQRAAQAGVAVYCWGVQSGEVGRLLDAGVQAVCGDDVPALVAATEGWARPQEGSLAA